MSGEEEMYDEMLGAYALDAVDENERRSIEKYLQINPIAAREVDEHRETAATLAWSSMAAPEGLWDRIAGSLDEHQPAPVPTGELARVMPMAEAVARRERRSSTTAWIVAAAAAAVALVLGVSTLRDDGGGAPSLAQAMEAASEKSDSRVVEIASPDGAVAAKVVVDPDGHGYLAGQSLPGLASDRTYQLWGLIDGKAISLGVLGHRPGYEMFSVEGNLTALMITNEAAGGVVSGGNPEGVLQAVLA